MASHKTLMMKKKTSAEHILSKLDIPYIGSSSSFVNLAEILWHQYTSVQGKLTKYIEYRDKSFIPRACCVVEGLFIHLLGMHVYFRNKGILDLSTQAKITNWVVSTLSLLFYVEVPKECEPSGAGGFAQLLVTNEDCRGFCLVLFCRFDIVPQCPEGRHP